MLLPSTVQQERVIHVSHLHVPKSHLKTQRKKEKKKKTEKTINQKIKNTRRSLVVQWLRSCLEVQGMQVRALVWEDCTRCGATKPTRHDYGACSPWSPWSITTEATARRRPCTAAGEWPLITATRESPHAAAKTQRSQKQRNEKCLETINQTIIQLKQKNQKKSYLRKKRPGCVFF